MAERAICLSSETGLIGVRICHSARIRTMTAVVVYESAPEARRKEGCREDERTIPIVAWRMGAKCSGGPGVVAAAQD